MIQSRNRLSRREEGFTLVELIVVILIIGVLAAIAIPSFLNQRKSSIDAQVKSDIIGANKIIETWIIKHPSRKIPSGTIVYSPSGVTTPSTLSSHGLKGFKLSKGTSLTITGKNTPRGTYTIVGKNPTGNHTSGAGLVYDSQKGGF